MEFWTKSKQHVTVLEIPRGSSLRIILMFPSPFVFALNKQSDWLNYELILCKINKTNSLQF